MIAVGFVGLFPALFLGLFLAPIAAPFLPLILSGL
jgi:hypothetical protein